MCLNLGSYPPSTYKPTHCGLVCLSNKSPKMKYSIDSKINTSTSFTNASSYICSSYKTGLNKSIYCYTIALLMPKKNQIKTNPPLE